MVGRTAESTSLAEGCRLRRERFKVEFGKKQNPPRSRAGYIAVARNPTHMEISILVIFPARKREFCPSFRKLIFNIGINDK